MIISISGYAGSGKDTAGKLIQLLMWCNRNLEAAAIPLNHFNISDWMGLSEKMKNELAAVKERGGITIRINRKPKFWNDNEWTDEMIAWHSKLHESETALDTAKFDHVVENNGTIEELAEKLKSILHTHNLITV